MTSMSTIVAGATGGSSTDPTAILNNQLASALSTLGDAQFWEETISPTTIRNELSASDPSSPNATPILQKGMKWLLASISKGRDVSDFYPHVVKLVGATSLEVRKMVYMYLVQYADHDATTRELSLLSINSFQRGLADSEQLIRALALRVLSSIRINDILQIQILAVQKCATDTSPYVRKCAANALAKLSPRCDAMQREILLQLMKEQLLDKDTSTMVLTSALVAFCELCPERLELLHGSFRKICHLLTDMDEWGQVVIIDLLARYCRRFFQEPKGWKQGTAELVDQERRVQRRLVRRTATGGGGTGPTIASGINGSCNGSTTTNSLALEGIGDSRNGKYRNDSNSSPNRRGGEAPPKVKRRVVTKGFYSDEEDGSAEEEVYVVPKASGPVSTAGAMGQRNIMGLPATSGGFSDNVNVHVNNSSYVGGIVNNNNEDDDMKYLDNDHQMLLTSSMPLLKSRNAGVVLSVCSLHYYCGISSIRARSAMGKALVRIHRGRREIQYVVLTSIRVLAQDCPSAFAPFLPDFFVKALDPPFTRLIKIDILVSLALEPAAIEAVLNELRTYIRHGDKPFSSAAIRAVGKVAELARVVYDRHGQIHGRAIKGRQTANRIALDALSGLAIVTQTSDSKVVVGEAVVVIHNILLLLGSTNVVSSGETVVVMDPNDVQAFALRRILLLMVNTLSNRRATDPEKRNEDEEDEEKEASDLALVSLDLPPAALSSSLWVMGEWLAGTPSLSTSSWTRDGQETTKVRQELVRLVDRCFSELDPWTREEGIHFASKVWISIALEQALSPKMSGSSPEIAMCEHILAMGRMDVNTDVKDRARFESSVLHASVGLKFDTDGMDERPGSTGMAIENAKRILLSKKPCPSYLPIDDDATVDMSSFRFGTLSSLVGHRARGTYLPLPNWAKENSPSVLREPIEAAKEQLAPTFMDPSQKRRGASTGFYGDDDDRKDMGDDIDGSDSSSASSNSSSSEESDGQNADSESDSDSDDDSTSDDSDSKNDPIVPKSSANGASQNNLLLQPMLQQTDIPAVPAFRNHLSSQASSDDESSSSDDDDDSSDDENYNGGVTSATLLNFPDRTTQATRFSGEGNLLGTMTASGFAPVPEVSSTAESSVMEDLKGLVISPISVQDPKVSEPDTERDSSAWFQLVRPELCGGLAVTARYLRGPTKEHELQMKNIFPSNPCIVCLQVQFENNKSGSNPIRRIKLLPRSGPSGPFATKKVLCPPEILELKANQIANALLILEFASMSNREGDLVGRLEVKQGSAGSVPIEIKPMLGELLRSPPKTTAVDEFDTTMHGMQGFQRVQSSFTTSLDMASILSSIIKQTSLTLVEKSDQQIRLIGLLPASNDPVLVLVESENGSGKMTVCCDHPVAVNSILSVAKRAILA